MIMRSFLLPARSARRERRGRERGRHQCGGEKDNTKRAARIHGLREGPERLAREEANLDSNGILRLDEDDPEDDELEDDDDVDDSEDDDLEDEDDEEEDDDDDDDDEEDDEDFDEDDEEAEADDAEEGKDEDDDEESWDDEED
jgi:ribonuclease E